jgi:NitT/TauT family transport system substrate-binding protein
VNEFTSSAFNRRSFLMMSVAAAGSPLLAACGQGAAGSGGGSGKQTTFLSYLPLETVSMAPELLGVAGGHFEKHGLNVKLQPVKGSPQAMQTLLSGIGPVSRVGQIDIMVAVAETGQPLVNIGTLNRGSSLRFMYSKKRHPLAKPEDFVGQTMGVPSEGGTSDKVVSLVMASGGLDPKQVKRQVVGLTPGTFNLVEQGRIVGYVVSIDTANLLMDKNPDAGAFDPAQYVKSDQQVYVTTKDAMQKDPETVRNFMAGIHDAVAAMVADTSLDETLKQLRSKYSFASLDNTKIAKASLTQLRNSWTGGDPSKPLLVTDPAVWTTGYKELTDAGIAKPGRNPAAWMDNGFLPKK